MDLDTEPPDGTRLEFEHHTDVYAAWRDDASSRAAGWSREYGWCLYPETVPKTWAQMVEMFGDSLKTAVRLVPHLEDVHYYQQWPGYMHDHWLATDEVDGNLDDPDLDDIPCDVCKGFCTSITECDRLAESA
jgi:hypothetical protein